MNCETAAGVIENAVEPLMEPEVPLIVVVPKPTPFPRPVALIVTTVVAEEAHVTVAVRSCVLLSENVPIALNCCVIPCATEPFAGVTAMELKVGPAGPP